MPRTPPPAAGAAEHWSPTNTRAEVACQLCYRRCTLAPGQSGWCKARGNRGGRMVTHGYGDVGGLWPLLMGYGIGSLTYYPGMLSLEVGAFNCTSACSFCIVANFSTHPERTPAHPKPDDPRPIYGLRARRTPAQVVATAERLGCQELFFTLNESMLTFEFTRDCARLALERGITSMVFTNGFSGAGPAKAIAPYVRNVMIGVKGSGDPAFYERYMRSPGALPTVYETALAFRDAGVRVTLTDTIAALHMQDDATAERCQRAYYGWIAREFGPTAVLRLGELHDYNESFASYGTLVSGRVNQHEATLFTQLRVHRATVIAQLEGLHYVEDDDAEDDTPVTCHACGLELVQPSPAHLEGDVMIFRPHAQRQVQGKCPGCGVTVPVHTLPGEQAARNIERWIASPPVAHTPRGLMRGNRFEADIAGELAMLRADVLD